MKVLSCSRWCDRVVQSKTTVCFCFFPSVRSLPVPPSAVLRFDVTSAANLAVQRSTERPVHSEEPLRLGCFGVSDSPAVRLHYEVCYSWSNEEQTQRRSQRLRGFNAGGHAGCGNRSKPACVRALSSSSGLSQVCCVPGSLLKTAKVPC